MEIARRSRDTPRIANRLLRRMRDYADVKGDGRISQALAQRALAMLDVDPLGLDLMDRKVRRQNRPVSLVRTRADHALREASAAVEQAGLSFRTSQRRQLSLQ